MKMTVQAMIDLQKGLMALDGYDKVIKDGEREKTARVYYELGGGLRLLIARNLNRIEPELKALEKARNETFMQYSNGENRISPDKAVDFMKAERALLDNEVEVELIEIDQTELKLDKNPIPGTVLSVLIPLLKGMP